jgi:hypothetical protein
MHSRRRFVGMLESRLQPDPYSLKAGLQLAGTFRRWRLSLNAELQRATIFSASGRVRN